MSKLQNPTPPLPTPGNEEDPMPFQDLFDEERKLVDEGADDSDRQAPGGQVTYTGRNRVGIALSGGGIRSATFNLGVLQGLQSLDLLKFVHYLSTVSGGGYIGGWWTAWISRGGDPSKLPEPTPGSPSPPEVRHLREFGNFLCPRKGFFDSETWGMLATVVGGLLWTASAGLAVLVLGMSVWLGMAMAAGCGSDPWRVLLSTPLVAAVLCLCEARWRNAGKARIGDRCPGTCTLASAVGLAVSALLLWFLPHIGDPETSVLRVWWLLPGEAGTAKRLALLGELLAPSAAWLGGAAAVLLLRACLVSFIWRQSRSGNDTGKGLAEWAAWERAGGRLLALSLIWAVLSLAWWLGQLARAAGGIPSQIGNALGALVTGAVFAGVVRTLAQRQTNAGENGNTKPSPWAKAMPPVLAYLAIGLLLVLVSHWFGSLMAEAGDPVWLYLPGGAGAVFLFVLFFYDPLHLSLHEFYRARIARTYLGASAVPRSYANHETQASASDDIPLEAAKHRPLHLICATANDLAGDPLPNLSRGARSAVLSPCGFSVDGKWREQTGTLPSLSSCLTAAAAAFNPNMGALSVALGPAATFLMAALNLRLGLWVGAQTGPKGWPLFAEMLGMTRVADDQPVHLSDGGHFENMALYELIRRRCRYVIVSDCGADPAMAFCDLGNAERRIREDFETEIEIDVSPLRPDANGLVRQHVVVGTIHYGGPTGADKGILVLVKPALTGDEPADVQHYRATHPDFPQQPTSDQFYDEAQWESYRRLGKHAIRSGLRCVETLGKVGAGDATPVFRRAREQWYPSPTDFDLGQREAVSSHAAFETHFWRNAPVALQQEFFRETATSTPLPTPSATEVVGWLLRVQEHMEELYSLCRLGSYWNHPRNLGWMNLMLRWCGSPTFRAWWPILRPLRQPAFRNFAETQLKLEPPRNSVPQVVESINVLNQRELAEGFLAANFPTQTSPRSLVEAEFLFVAKITLAAEPPGEVILQALAVHRSSTNPRQAEWYGSDFLALPGLWGSGFGTDFLRQVQEQLRTGGFDQCAVTIGREGDAKHTDAGTRRQTTDQLAFYQNCGYVLAKQNGPSPLLRRPI